MFLCRELFRIDRKREGRGEKFRVEYKIELYFDEVFP